MIKTTAIYLLFLLGIFFLNTYVSASQINTQWEWLTPELTNNALQDIAYAEAEQLSLVVGSHGTVLLKSGQDNWQIQNSQTLKSLYSVVWGNNQFVAVGEQGTIIISSNGVDWQVSSMNTEATLKKIYWDGEKYIALARSQIFFSNNALDWQEATILLQQSTLEWLGIGSISLQDVTKSNDQFIAVTWFGSILSSLDGINWVELPRQKEPGTVYFYDISGNSSFFLITGATNVSPASDSRTINLLSIDGQQWSVQENEQSFSATFWDGTNPIAYSYNGNFYSGQFDNENSLSWQPVSTSETDVYTAIYTGENYIIAGRRGLLASSVNGTSWQYHNSLERADHLSSVSKSDITWNGQFYLLVKHVCLSGGFFCLANRDTLHISHDGIEWNLVHTIEGKVDHVLWDGRRFIVSSYNEVSFSDNGLDWETHHRGQLMDFTDIIYNGQVYIATTLSMNLLTSQDAMHWQSVSIDGIDTFYINNLNWNGKQFLALGERILYSYDGLSWEQQTNERQQYPFSVGVKAIAWNGSNYIAVKSTGCFPNTSIGGCGSMTGRIYSSLDGRNWSLIQEFDGIDFTDIAWNGEYYTIIGHSNESGSISSFIATTDDIFQWDRQYELRSSESFKKLYWNGRQWLVLGNQGSLIRGNEGGIQCNTTNALYSSLGNSLLLKTVTVENAAGEHENFKQVRLMRVPGSMPVRFRLSHYSPDERDKQELCESTNVLQDNVLYIPKALVNDEYNNPRTLRNIQMKTVIHNGELDLILSPNNY